MLTAWVTEKDLLAHPDLKMPFDVYHRGHNLAAAALDHEGREEPGDRTDKYHGFGANDFSATTMTMRTSWATSCLRTTSCRTVPTTPR